MAIDEAKAAEIQGSSLYLLQPSSSPNTRSAQLKARETHIRESWVKAMEARIVRDNLSKCQKIEGVNHYEKCKQLAERYADMLKENRVRRIVRVPWVRRC
jgi:NADH dehydrogenase (ubiquinone) 1 beta subcomplex subunit 10